MNTAKDMILEGAVSIGPDDNVESALAMLRKKKLFAVPVVDKTGVLVGIFGYRQILRELLPVSVATGGGNLNIEAAPGIGRRMQRIGPGHVHEVMDRNPEVVGANAQVWEVVRLLVEFGGPLPVIDENTNRFLGVIGEYSVISALATSPSGG
jgi:CBS domain-containing protein